MAQYEKVFTKPYEDGYENLPSQNTPITASTLNDKDTAIEHIEDFLDGQEFPTAEEKAAWNAKADITSIGIDESGRTTASKAYAIGEHFYKDGKFCTAKTAIASGGTFTLNTNYEEGDISTSLKSAEDTLNNDVLKCIQFGGNANKKFTFSINNSRFFVKLYGASGETVAYRAMFRIYLNYTLYNVWKETNSGNINDLSIAIVNNQLVITVPAYTEWQIEFKAESGISLVSQSTS